MAIFVLLVFIAIILLLFTNKFRASLVFFTSLSIFFILGVISTDELLESFTNNSLVNLVMLLVVASVIDKTVMFSDVRRYFAQSEKSLWKASGLAAFLSAFLNNTLVVALFIKLFPEKRLARKMLLPICFITTLGGTCSLIGTSTNLVVNSFVEKANLPSIGLFDFAWIGLPITIVGIVFLLFLAPRILVDEGEGSEESVETYFLEALVEENSPLIGKTISENRLRNMENLFLAELIRDHELISPVTPTEKLEAGDILVFTGDVKNIKELQNFSGLKVFEEQNSVLSQNLVRTFISHQSDLIGTKIKDANFRNRFDAAVVAVKRANEKLSGKIGLIRLAPGDEVVLATGPDFYNASGIDRHFYLTDALQIRNRLSSKQSWAVILTFALAIILSACGVLELFKALLLLLLIYMGFRFLSIQELKEALPLDLIILVGSAIGVGTVLMNAGTAEMIALWTTGMFEGTGVAGNLIAIYLVTVIFSELMANNAAAALVMPIAFSTAHQLGVDPIPFAFAVAFGASSSFITAFGYQTNQMVANAVGYKPMEFVKLGLPLTFLYGILAVLLLLWRYSLL